VREVSNESEAKERVYLRPCNSPFLYA
jgi:hypothetical protein